MALPNPMISERVLKGREIYRRLIDAKVETENYDRLVVFDEETEDFEIGDDLIEICHRLKARQPNTRTFGFRIGGGGRAIDRFGSPRVNGAR